jgi:hypothetical protein
MTHNAPDVHFNDDFPLGATVITDTNPTRCARGHRRQLAMPFQLTSGVWS